MRAGIAALAGAAASAVGRLMGDTPTGRTLQAVLPGISLAISAFMVLDQLNIAPQIVTITYAGLITLLVLAGGLAFGLGGRDVAADMLRDATTAAAGTRTSPSRAKMRQQGRFARSGADGAGSPTPSTTVRTTSQPSPPERPDHTTG
jgi:hypothetical protein